MSVNQLCSVSELMALRIPAQVMVLLSAVSSSNTGPGAELAPEACCCSGWGLGGDSVATTILGKIPLCLKAISLQSGFYVFIFYSRLPSLPSPRVHEKMFCYLCSCLGPLSPVWRQFGDNPLPTLHIANVVCPEPLPGQGCGHAECL